MARPTRLKLIEERPAVPVREEDAVAEAPVAARVEPAAADAIIAALRQESETNARRAAEAENRAQAAETQAGQAAQTVEALAAQARERIAAVESERDTALAAAAERQDERKQAIAMTTAVSLGLAQKVLAEAAKLAAWVPALGALAGGFWLFNSAISGGPLPAATLGALALYGLVVVAPAVVVTLHKRG